MPRRPRNTTTDPGRKARVKSSRSTTRRKERRAAGPDPSDTSWLTRSLTIREAERVLNERKVFSYWLSMEVEGNPPTAMFYPCKFYVRGDRVYYGFMFRDHREHQVLEWPNARRELIDAIRALQFA